MPPTANDTTVEWLRFEHMVEELYDVAVTAGVVQPEAVGFRGDAIAQMVPAEA